MCRATSVVASSLLLVLASSELVAQRNSWRVTTPSPTAASLGKFGDVPVSLYTGVPDISIPLFTAKGRTLALPIVLKYHAGGIKVEEIGSWVGIGWTLEAGGTITRTVRGLVDEDLGRGYYYTGNTWYNSNNWPNPTTQVIGNLFTSLRDEMIDGEPDQFFFDFAGRSGQFVMGPTGASGPIEYKAIPYQKLKIEPTFQSNMISAWTITAEDGTVYTFGAAETSTDYTTTTSTEESSHWLEVHTSSWHLTSIAAPDGDVITLQYVGYTAQHKMGHSREKFDYRQAPGGGACVNPVFDVWSEFQIGELRLASITTAAHTITFTPGVLRADALSPTGGAQEPTLDKITIATAGPPSTVLRAFKFDYDYSTGRLTLKSVAEQDRNGVSLPPYTFAYDPLALPDRASNATDHWGYYNGASGNTDGIPQMMGPYGSVLTGANRGPNPAFMRAGILTKVTYPTGGYNQFIYEANEYGVIADGTVMIDTVPAQSVSSSSWETPYVTFTVGGTYSAHVTVYVSQEPPAPCTTDDPPCPNWSMGGGPAGVTLTGDGHGNFYGDLQPGTYWISTEGTYPQAWVIVDVSWSEQVEVKRKTAGGLRVAQVLAADGMGPNGGNVTVRKYDYNLLSDPTRSSGVVSNEPKYAYWYWSPGCAYFSRSSMSKMPLGDGTPVAYREVTLLHGAGGEFGRTRHTFRSFVDVMDPLPDGSVWPFSRRTNFDWMRGQETGSTEYNAAGQPQRRFAAVHAFQQGGAITSRSFHGMSVNTFSAGQFGTTYAYNPFEVLSMWSYLSEDTTVTYDEAGAGSFATARTYTYGNPNHVQLTQLTETNSNGTQRITRMTYPADYAPCSGSCSPEAAALTAMQGGTHMHSEVIERWVTERTGSSERVVQGDLTTFKAYTDGRYRPFQHFVFNSPGAP